MKEKNTNQLRLTEPFKFGRFESKAYKATGGNNTHIFYKEYDRELNIEGSGVLSTPHRRVVSLWSL